MAIKLGVRKAIKSDNKHVVDWNGQSDFLASMGDAVHAGALREGLRALKGQSRPLVFKVVGHAREKRIAIPLVDAIGNESADEAAGLGEAMHPQPTERQFKDTDRAWKMALLVATLASQVLSLWLRPARLEFALPRFRRLKASKSADVPVEHQHKWGYAWGKWQCLICSRMSKDPLCSSARFSYCRGFNRVLQGILANPQGHHLVGFSIRGQTFLICLKCGGWSNTRARLLDVRCCRMPVSAGKTALSKLRQGRYPHSDAKFADLRVEGVFPLVGGVADPTLAGHRHLGPVMEPAVFDAMSQ